MTHDYMIHMYPSGSDTCSSAKKISDLVGEEWWCGTCNAPRLDARCIDFQIAESEPVHSPLSSAAYSEVCLATNALLTQIDEHSFGGDIFRGNLTGPNGNVFSDWATFRCRHRAIIRGSASVSCRICDECGKVHYFATGKRYICLPLAGRLPVMQSQLDGIVLTPELFEKMDLGIKRNVQIEQVALLDEPLDGFSKSFEA